jgi:hypothetical protein
MPILTPGQERKSGRRWLMIGLALTLVAPLLLLGMAYAVLRWGPVPRFSTCQVGSLRIVRTSDELSARIPEGLSEPPYPPNARTPPEQSRLLRLGDHVYWVWW